MEAVSVARFRKPLWAGERAQLERRMRCRLGHTFEAEPLARHVADPRYEGTHMA
jgi:hypothetical protein